MEDYVRDVLANGELRGDAALVIRNAKLVASLGNLPSTAAEEIMSIACMQRESERLVADGQLGLAVAAYRRVAGAAPWNSMALGRLAALLSRTGAEDEAVEHLKRAFRLDPADDALAAMIQRLERGQKLSASL